MRNRSILILTVIGVLSCTTPAAARYGYCYVGSYGGDRIFLSGTMDFGEDSESYLPARNDFSGAVNRPVNRIECEGHFARAHEAEDQRKRKIAFERAVIEDTGWTGRYAAALRAEKPSSSGASITVKETSAKSVPLTPSALPKYVEVAGPNGKQRLSPEVAARNQAAADDYRRKMDEHARARAEHERKLALHQQSIAAASAEKRAYEQKMALNNAQVAAHGAALEQHKSATRPPAKGSKGWMYCDARGDPGDKRRFYSRVTEVDYEPGAITIIDVMARNRPAFKSYVASTHSIYFATDSLLHCPYSTTSMADAEALMARDKLGDGNNGIEIVQTGWVPAS